MAMGLLMLMISVQALMLELQSTQMVVQTINWMLMAMGLSMLMISVRIPLQEQLLIQQVAK